MKEEYKKFRRKQIAELRNVTSHDIQRFKELAGNLPADCEEQGFYVSISDVDRQSGSPKKGDMIARNPKNHQDQWLIAKDYFEENFESINQ